MEVKIEGDLLEGIFINRANRFIAEVIIDGNLEKVHVANTGRMKELLIKGAKVIVRRVNNVNRKTNFDLLMVYKENILVMIDSKIPNIILEKAFIQGGLKKFSNKYDVVKREVTYGKSRFDLALSNNKEKVLVEAKCATLVKENGIATFPDAPTIRGRKHIEELVIAKENGFRAAVFFIIQRKDALFFTPNESMDHEFAMAVRTAYNSGVEFYAYICEVNPDRIKIFKEIPVIIE